jgi:hypothetical protein
MAGASIAVGLAGHTFWVGPDVAVLGLFGGLYLVPQTTIFQLGARGEARRVSCGAELVNYLFMLFAALIFGVLTNQLHLTPTQIFLAVGVGLAGLGVAQALTMGPLVLGPLKALLGRKSDAPIGKAA